MKWVTTLMLLTILHYHCGQSFRLLPLGFLNEKMMSISTEMAGELDEEDILDIKLALLKAVHEMKSASLKQLQAIGEVIFNCFDHQFLIIYCRSAKSFGGYGYKNESIESNQTLSSLLTSNQMKCFI